MMVKIHAIRDSFDAPIPTTMILSNHFTDSIIVGFDDEDEAGYRFDLNELLSALIAFQHLAMRNKEED